MADLLDNCRFTAGSTGTGDFADGTADPSFQNLEDAGAVDGRKYPYKAQNATGTEWEFGRATALETSGGWVLERTSIEKSSNGGLAVNFTTQPKVAIAVGRQELQDAWALQPIGVPIPVYTSLWGTLFDALPPRDRGYRYILLTAGEDGTGEYNEGVLDGESVSGSAPLVSATANINDPGGPLDNDTVRLINTERRFLRAGSAGMVENDAFQNFTGYFRCARWNANGAEATGPFTRSNFGSDAQSSGTAVGNRTDFDPSLVARTDTETRSKNVGMNYVMRIH